MSFELATSNSTFRVALKLVDDDTMRGEVTREREGEKQTMQLELKRAK